MTSVRAVPGRIRPLPDHLINRIAAGEVIERPANVVKELIENSLDAGAGRVEVELDAGGRERIEVRDDGHGIAEPDLARALERHCTSKLETFDDLAGIATLGFRGEALASIAAVSSLTLRTRARGERLGYEVHAERGASRVNAVAHPVGTTVIVRDLFGDLPARQRFLRGPGIELAHVQGMVRQLAFAAPGASFLLRHGGRQLISVPAGSGDAAAQRLGAIFGAAFAAHALRVERRGAIAVHGWISPPEQARNQRDLQVLVVNGRPVRDRHLHHAIRLAFGDSIAEGQFPAYALYVTVPAVDVDVNVHPAKLEVRFAVLRDVHDAVYGAVNEALPASVRVPGAVHEAAYTGYRVPDRLSTGTARGSAPRSTVVAGRYYVSVSDSSVVIVDIPAVIASGVARELASGVRGPGRRLLVPVAWPDRDVDDATRAALTALGFELGAADGGLLEVRAVPKIMPPVDAEVLIDELAATHADPETVGRCASRAWTGELTPALERSLERAREHRLLLDAPTISRLLSTP